MKYMLTINQGSAPTPPSEEWDRLSDGERKAISDDYAVGFRNLRSYRGRPCRRRP